MSSMVGGIESAAGCLGESGMKSFLITLGLALVWTGVMTDMVTAGNPMVPRLKCHPFHISVAEIEYNQETGKLEFALRVWPEDLEKALSQSSRKQIDLDKTKEIDEMVFQYLQKNIDVVAADKKKCKLTWVGKEVEVKQAWLYFEIDVKNEPVSYTYSNRMFFELQEDQINLFNLKLKRRRASMSFTGENSRHRLTADDFVPIRNPFADRQR